MGSMTYTTETNGSSAGNEQQDLNIFAITCYNEKQGKESNLGHS